VIGLTINLLRAVGWSTVASFQGAFALFAACCTLAHVWFIAFDDGVRVVRPRCPARSVDNLAMPGLMIIAHAPLASSLKAVAEHAFPECSGVIEALDVAPGDSIEMLEAAARAKLQRIGDPDALILTDVFGATPCNVAQRLSGSVHVRVIAGVNVPMLWRALCYAGEPLDSVAGRAMVGATQGVFQVVDAEPRGSASTPGTP
jgi:mannose PTS system EIIA component